METLSPLMVKSGLRSSRSAPAGVRLLLLGGSALSSALYNAATQASSNVVSACTVEEARELLKQERFDVFLFVAEWLDAEGDSLLMEARANSCASIALISPYETFIAEGWKREGYLDGYLSTVHSTPQMLSTMVAEVGKPRLSRFVVPSAIHIESVETPLEKLDRLAALPYALSLEAFTEKSLWADLLETAGALRSEVISASSNAAGTEQRLDYLIRLLAREVRFIAPQQESLRQYLCAIQSTTQVFPVAEAINEALDMLELVWERENILLRCRIAPSLPTIRANRHKLQQSLIALLLNAVEALGEEGGTLVLTAEPEWDSAENVQGVCITLRDSGCGMGQETLSRVRQEGFTTKPREGALGMGANFADAFARATRGRLDIESALGRGTTVTLRLPALHASTQDTTRHNLFTSARSRQSHTLAAA